VGKGLTRTLYVVGVIAVVAGIVLVAAGRKTA